MDFSGLHHGTYMLSECPWSDWVWSVSTSVRVCDNIPSFYGCAVRKDVFVWLKFCQPLWLKELKSHLHSIGCVQNVPDFLQFIFTLCTYKREWNGILKSTLDFVQNRSALYKASHKVKFEHHWIIHRHNTRTWFITTSTGWNLTGSEYLSISDGFPS